MPTGLHDASNVFLMFSTGDITVTYLIIPRAGTGIAGSAGEVSASDRRPVPAAGPAARWMSATPGPAEAN